MNGIATLTILTKKKETVRLSPVSPFGKNNSVCEIIERKRNKSMHPKYSAESLNAICVYGCVFLCVVFVAFEWMSIRAYCAQMVIFFIYAIFFSLHLNNNRLLVQYLFVCQMNERWQKFVIGLYFPCVAESIKTDPIVATECVIRHCHRALKDI